MNALADAEVGRYVNANFVSSFQKVGTFQIVNGQKQGGNVASYFCLPDGRVLHVVVGPADAATLLREARWVVETRKLALVETGNEADQYREFFRKAHADRLRQLSGITLRQKATSEENPVAAFAQLTFGGRGDCRKLDPQARVHLLLAAFPLAKVQAIYRVVFEKILGEKVSTLPVG